MHSESLHTHLKQNAGRLPDEEKRRFVCETAAGLAYLAENNCIHRDIAARNCKLNDALVKPAVNSANPAMLFRGANVGGILGRSRAVRRNDP
ncbi:hypothetical protein ANCCEY_01276 [Ancylostoma ceylanicum]|uniref:Protein kinase domain-containing protein n=1 Tax=Ancylostoma ceylanicum TaxID=53326 RepID=A0A0D6M623_9BILA|nr:hypothetical protein ANCCEY_01276 [Ancylostoma ceylanicum]